MKKEIAMQWVAALRSGEYRQGAGQLRTAHDTFCCLGVLCNLHAQAHPEIAAKQDAPKAYMGNTAVLPTHVRDWAELVHWDPRVPGCTAMASPVALSHLNDTGATFNEIADLIEQHWSVM